MTIPYMTGMVRVIYSLTNSYNSNHFFVPVFTVTRITGECLEDGELEEDGKRAASGNLLCLFY